MTNGYPSLSEIASDPSARDRSEVAERMAKRRSQLEFAEREATRRTIGLRPFPFEIVELREANDNPISGKSARSWPLMERARAGTLFRDDPDRNKLAINAIEAFSMLYEVCELGPPHQSNWIVGLEDIQADNDDEESCRGLPAGLQPDSYIDMGPTPERLIRLHSAGRLRFSRYSDDRSKKSNLEKGNRTSTAIVSLSSGRQWTIFETYKSRGPSSADEPDEMLLAHTVHSTGRDGAVAIPYHPETWIIAREALDRLRSDMGQEAFDDMVAVSSHCATARALGEAHGATYKRAEALGGALMSLCVDAAIRCLAPTTDNTAAAAA